MSAYPSASLGELCEVNIGRTPSRSDRRYWGEGSAWLSIADMNQGRKLAVTKEQITDIAVREANMRIAPADTVLLSFKLSIGKVGITTVPMFTNEAIAALPIRDSQKLLTNYLFWALQSVDLAEGQDRAAMGATLNKAKLLQLSIPTPPLDEQRRIAAILDQAETLRTQRRQALAHLDTLTQSLFLEMFGDPVANPKFQTGTIREFVEANSGKSAKAVLSESLTDVPVYGGNGINGWATAPLYEQPVLVFGRVGQQCGNAFLTEGPSWVTDNAIVVRITDISRLIAKYVLHAFQGSDFSSRVKHLDLPFINQGMILDNPIPLPPIALQQTFATRIQAIEALKATHRAALAQLDALFASLQQRAFAGEL